jgi:Putative motility protein
MNVSGSGSASLFDSVLQTQALREEIGVRLLKKSQDVATQQGEAMVQLLEQAGQPLSRESGQLLDTYA